MCEREDVCVERKKVNRKETEAQFPQRHPDIMTKMNSSLDYKPLKK